MSEIKEFWDNAHRNDETLWLTGTYLNEVWKNLNLLPLLHSGLTVLNVGVGLGHDSRELARVPVTLDVLDISHIALDRVKNITRRGYLAENLESLPINEYDIAVSHLVSQHMNDEDLSKQITYVLRSLKPTGIFGMQLAFIDETPEALKDLNRVYESVKDIPNDKKGHMFRTVEKMSTMVENCGGKITWVSGNRVYPHTPIKWYYVHMQKV